MICHIHQVTVVKHNTSKNDINKVYKYSYSGKHWFNFFLNLKKEKPDLFQSSTTGHLSLYDAIVRLPERCSPRQNSQMVMEIRSRK